MVPWTTREEVPPNRGDSPRFVYEKRVFIDDGWPVPDVVGTLTRRPDLLHQDEERDWGRT